VNADPYLQGVGERRVQRLHGRHDAQPGPHGPWGGIFLGYGVAEVDEQAVTEILGDVRFRRKV
jgi:hypothetical protein